jgi:membrane protein
MFKIVSNLNGAKMNNIIFFISALVLASNGTYSLIVISNRIYKIKNKGLLYDRLKSIGMLFILILLFLFIMIVPVLGNYITRTLNTVLHNDVSQHIRNIYNIFNLPLSWLFIFYSIKLLYMVSPDARISRKHVTYGALFTSFSWVVFTKIYSMYLNSFVNFNNIYGSISNVIILMWWIYFLSYIYVLGMALNVTKYEEKEV